MRLGRRFWRCGKQEEQLEKELRFLLDEHAQDLITAGMEPDLARRRAAIDLGDRSLKGGLVATQIALSIVLLAGAGLLGRSLWKLESQSLGMRSDHLLAAQLILPTIYYRKPEERIAFFNQLEKHLHSIPGMRADRSD